MIIYFDKYRHFPEHQIRRMPDHPHVEIDNFPEEVEEFLCTVMALSEKPKLDDTITLGAMLDAAIGSEHIAERNAWLMTLQVRMDRYYGEGLQIDACKPLWMLMAEIRNLRQRNFLEQR